MTEGLTTKVKFGKPVPLLADAKGFPNGRLVQFEIWKQTGQSKEKITEANGVVRQEKGVAQWEPQFKREPELRLKEKIDQEPQKEQYSFIALIDKDTAEEKKVQGTPIEFTYPLEIYVEDLKGEALNDVKFTVTCSDGTKKEGILRSGHGRIEDVPAGKFQIQLESYDFVFKFGKIINARWDKKRAKIGDKIKMMVEVKDFDDGTPADFKIWEGDVAGDNDLIQEISSKVQGNRVEAEWVYSPEQLSEDLEGEPEKEEGEPEYFFEVGIEGEKARSGLLTFTYTVDIYLEDEEEKPLEDVDYIITFSNGAEKKGKFKKGHAKIEDAPYGNFIVEVEGYDFSIDSE